MGRTYLADKETLDNVNTNIGATGDTNGTTLFGKLNALLTSWTSARAAKVDTIATDASGAMSYAQQAAQTVANVSANTAIIIDRINALEAKPSVGQKILVSGDSRNEIPFAPNQGTWCIGALNIVGAGVVHAIYVNDAMDAAKNIVLTIDGRTYELGRTTSSDMKYIIQSSNGQITYTTGTYASTGIPIRFKQGFKLDIDVIGAGNTKPYLRVGYATYQDI